MEERNDVFIQYFFLKKEVIDFKNCLLNLPGMLVYTHSPRTTEAKTKDSLWIWGLPELLVSSNQAWSIQRATRDTSSNTQKKENVCWAKVILQHIV